MGTEYKYDAFISYRHTSPDKEIAEKLQKKLENYKPPKALRDLKKRGRWHIFRDETELPTSSDLSSDIKNALEESRFLIVLCSQTTKNSRWCLEEIEYFKELHNGNNANIITLVADGNPEDVFPSLLCNELIPVIDEYGNTTFQNHIIEPLAANVVGKTLNASLKKLNTEFLRIAAPILGCGYDDLYNREHKKKIRRVFTISGIVIALLLLLGFYNSAMLWKINNQKAALAAANVELQQKTEELDYSNQSLKQSNIELEKKTKEAEDNLEAANKQKQAAEENLLEAERQKTIAEKNLSEANRQKKIAENNLAEVNRQRGIAESNAKEANEQRNIAENNAKEANEQRNLAENNAKEANEQRNLAENNAKEANEQRNIAEINMRIAQDNEAAANEANKNLKIKTSEVLARQAKIYLEEDNAAVAVQTAIEALELGDDSRVSTDAENVLIEATGAYSTEEKMLCSKLNLSGYVEFIGFSEDGSRIFAADSNGTIYVIDYEKSKVIKSYTLLEAFGETIGYLKDIKVDGNIGYVLAADRLLSINLDDGSIRWHYDSEKYVYFYEIVTNSNSDYIFLGGRENLAMLRKEDGKVCYSKKIDYDFNVDDYMYMDSAGVLYIAYDNNCLRVVNPVYDVDLKYELGVNVQYNILGMGENRDNIFLNLCRKSSDDGTDNAVLLCFNKADMSLKWKSDYRGENLSQSNFNKIFEFTHNFPDDSGDLYEKTGIVAVSGQNIAAFEKDSGKVYFRITKEYDDRILFCRPVGKRLMIGTPNSISTETYLNKSDNNDELLSYKGYSMDETRKYIACTDNERYALASNYSSEISIYRKYIPSQFTALDKFSVPTGGVDKVIDNGNGIIAASYSRYDDSKQKHYYVIIFDVCNNKILAKTEVDIKINAMKPVGADKLFLADSDGNAEVLKLDGSIYAKMNLKDMIVECIDSADTNTYFNFYEPYIKTTENTILCMINRGIFKIKLSDGMASMQKVLYNKDLQDYCMDGDMVVCIQKDYAANADKIMYFKDGDKTVSYIHENGQDYEFKMHTVSSVVCNGVSDTIAFLSKEGYIGIYEYGDDKISKISLPTGEIAPLKIIFSPDAKYIIAMCSNGEFIKYSIETLQQVDKYTADITLNSYSDYELKFIDETTFMFSGYIGSTALIVDMASMGLKAKLKNFVYYTEEEKKLLTYKYIDGNQILGYFDYLSQKELIDFANSFLNN